jgi:hypothetical protein
MNEAGLHVIKDGQTILFKHGEEEVCDAAMAIRKALKDFLEGEGVSDERIDG